MGYILRKFDEEALKEKQRKLVKDRRERLKRRNLLSDQEVKNMLRVVEKTEKKKKRKKGKLCYESLKEGCILDADLIK